MKKAVQKNGEGGVEGEVDLVGIRLDERLRYAPSFSSMCSLLSNHRVAPQGLTLLRTTLPWLKGKERVD